MKRSVIGVLVVLALASGAPASGEAIGGGGGSVEGVVTDLGSGVFQYDYTLYAGGVTDETAPALKVFVGGTINSFLIPFFDPEAVAIIPGSIQAPFGWVGEFQNTPDSFWSYDPLFDPDSGNYEVPADVFVSPPYVLEFSSNVLAATISDSLEFEPLPLPGFSFQSHYSDTNGPVVLGYAEGGSGPSIRRTSRARHTRPLFPSRRRSRCWRWAGWRLSGGGAAEPPAPIRKKERKDETHRDSNCGRVARRARVRSVTSERCRHSRAVHHRCLYGK